MHVCKHHPTGGHEVPNDRISSFLHLDYRMTGRRRATTWGYARNSRSGLVQASEAPNKISIGYGYTTKGHISTVDLVVVICRGNKHLEAKWSIGLLDVSLEDKVNVKG